MQLTAGRTGTSVATPGPGFPIAVLYKFFEDQGAYLAALTTYYGFLSLFPLLLLLASLLGFVLQSNPDLQVRILDSALRQFPVIGDQLGDPQALQGNRSPWLVGGLVALYGALGAAQALQHAMNVAWSVPRNRRPNPLKARLRSLLLLATAGVAVLATTVAVGARRRGGVAGGSARQPGRHRGRHRGQRERLRRRLPDRHRRPAAAARRAARAPSSQR